jgi:hypothetical protein
MRGYFSWLCRKPVRGWDSETTAMIMMIGIAIAGVKEPLFLMATVFLFFA